MSLTDRDRAVLEFERLTWRYEGAKMSEALERFGLSSPRYYQVLNAILDKPAALAYDGPLVARLLRLREQRRAARTAVRQPRA